jgi:hypothetical protein
VNIGENTVLFNAEVKVVSVLKKKFKTLRFAARNLGETKWKKIVYQSLA